MCRASAAVLQSASPTFVLAWVILCCVNYASHVEAVGNQLECFRGATSTASGPSKMRFLVERQLASKVDHLHAELEEMRCLFGAVFFLNRMWCWVYPPCRCLMPFLWLPLSLIPGFGDGVGLCRFGVSPCSLCDAKDGLMSAVLRIASMRLLLECLSSPSHLLRVPSPFFCLFCPWVWRLSDGNQFLLG